MTDATQNLMGLQQFEDPRCPTCPAALACITGTFDIHGICCDCKRLFGGVGSESFNWYGRTDDYGFVIGSLEIYLPKWCPRGGLPTEVACDACCKKDDNLPF